MTEKDDFDLYVFLISSDKNQKSGLYPDMKSNNLYSISFTIGKANAILSFSRTDQKTINTKKIAGYEISFAKEFLNKETIILSEKLELFKSELPVMFLISRHQEWRLKEIFEIMLDESTRTDLHSNEMMRTLMHELVLFSQRLLTVDTNSV